jgi:hypothetical protein
MDGKKMKKDKLEEDEDYDIFKKGREFQRKEDIENELKFLENLNNETGIFSNIDNRIKELKQKLKEEK